VPLVGFLQSRPVDHPFVVVPALMGGTSQFFVSHTLLGPEETAEPVLFREAGRCLLQSRIAQRSHTGSPHDAGVVWCVSGCWVVSRWVFEI